MSRRRAREMVLRALYRMDVTRCWTPGMEEPGGVREERVPEDARGFIHTLTDGVTAHRKDLDVLIEKYSEHWKVDRMPVVDRNILRMGIFELQNFPETPAKVAINEAVELGKRYNSDESASFINALLDRVAREELHRDPDREP